MFRNQFFRSPTIRLRRSDGDVEVREGSGRDIWAVPRGACVAFALRTPVALPAAKRRDALTLEARRRAPYERAGLHLHDQGEGGAFAWVWDAAQQEERALGAGLALDEILILPETALREVDRFDGARLVRRGDGAEGLVWREGVLIASRWWPDRPSSAQWRDFLRAARCEGPEEPALLEAEAWAQRPWTTPVAANLLEFAPSKRAESRLRRIGAAAFAAVLAFAAGSLAQSIAVRLEASGEAAAARRRASDVLAMQSRAIADVDAARAITELTVGVDPIAVMEAVRGALPANARLIGFSVRGSELAIEVTQAGAGGAALGAAALEAAAMFEDVAVEDASGAGDYRLIARIVGA